MSAGYFKDGGLRPFAGGQIPPDSALDPGSKNAVENRAIFEALQRLENLENETRALRATLSDYGLAKLSDSEAVTDSTGLALPATEKNASIEGTLANRIEKVDGKVNGIVGLKGAFMHGNFIDCNSLPIGYSGYIYSDTKNIPTGSPGGVVFCVGVNNNEMIQIITTQTKFWFRHRQSGTWQSWVSVV